MWRRWLIVSAITLFLLACVQVTQVQLNAIPSTTMPFGVVNTLANQQGQASSTFASITIATALHSTSTPVPSYTPVPLTPTPTQVECMRIGGRVEVYEITSVLLPDPLVFRIYLPPCYDEDTERAYPVLYLIHGQTYNDAQWDSLGVPEVADRLIAAGEVAPFIVVMPRDRVWLEPTQDKFGLAVEQALVPWIDEHYRTIPDRAHRAIGGLSRGAAWAVDIGLSHWELFGAIGVHSGFVFESDVQPIYLWLHDIPDGMIPRIYMDIGNDDRPEMAKAASWLENLLTQLDIPHEWHMFVGEHEEAYWRSHVEDYLRWYTMEWGN